MKNKFIILVLAILTVSCATEKSGEMKIGKISVPCKEGGESNLFVSKDGKAYLSWVEYTNDTTDVLVFSQLVNGEWSPCTEIASGTDWFVNWADFPSLVATDDNLAAHWLQKSAAGTYEYDIKVRLSDNGGKEWGSPFILHRDSVMAEHGFVSMFPLEGNRFFVAWLDGRKTKMEGDEDAGHGHDHGHGQGHEGAMTLRAAEFDMQGQLSNEVELDDKVCDCCQTSAAMTAQGAVVVYRDRLEDEIRDISIVRKVGDGWTKPMRISEDNWKITGCPVNGPAITANGADVAVAWFTMEGEKPKVKIAFSKDSGGNFGEAQVIDDGNALGRVDAIHLNNGKVLVIWMEQKENHAEIRGRMVSGTSDMQDSFLISETSESRSSGFPVLKKHKDGALVSWTQVDSSKTSVQSAFLEW